MSLKKKPSIVRSFRLLDFRVYDESTTDDYSDSGSDEIKVGDNLQFMIQMFGINERGETCCLYINDYLPFFYVRVGDNWTNSTKDLLVHHLQNNPKLSKKFKNSIVSSELVEYKKLYGFSGGRNHKFVKLEFNNTSSMNKYKNLWFTFNKDSKKEADLMIRTCADAMQNLLIHGLNPTMNKFNS